MFAEVNFICPTGHFCPFIGSNCPDNPGTDVDPWNLIGWANSANQDHATNPCIRKCPGDINDINVGDSIAGIGKYNDNTGATSWEACKPCSSLCENDGMSSDGACAAGIDCQTGNDCPSGYYCEENSPASKPCPLGTYMEPSTTGASDISSCLNCPQGKYCSTSGLIREESQLPDCNEDGFHCEESAQVSKPSQYVCPEGSTCQSGQISQCTGRQTTLYKGATDCQDCPDGFTCDGADSTAEICTDGYCKDGQSETCPAGTFMNGDGLFDIEHCSPCSSGFTCPDGINREECPDDLDYCKSSAGGTCADSGECPGGYRCPENNKEPIPCDAGTYSDPGTTDECTPCVQGHYCPIGTSRSDMETNFVCQNGYYCPTGTKSAIEYPCPKGKLGGGTRLIESAQCDDCPAGQYCEQPGGTAASGSCAAGYKCPLGTNAETAWPSNSLCGVGYVCGEGTEDDGLVCF